MYAVATRAGGPCPHGMNAPVGVALIVLLSCVPDSTAAQQRSPDASLELPLMIVAPTVDGRLSEAEWEGALTLPLPWETSPAVNGPAPVATLCRLGRDEDHLYLGCLGSDPDPGQIRAQFVDRDEAEDQDGVTLVLDPFDDGQSAFVFTVSAVGVQGDAVFDQVSGVRDGSWNAIWESAGRLTNDGYELEASIPFRSLRYPTEATTSRAWRFYLERLWPRSEAHTLRSTRYDPNDPCDLCYVHRLATGPVASPGWPVEAVPTLTTTRSDRRQLGASELTAGPADPEIGLDLRWAPSGQLAVNATVNPDFSHIEADALQLESNARFALFVPERRPFFLEGADTFRSPIRAIFTRSINDPSVGLKLAGRSGAWSSGWLYARDESTGLLIPGSVGSSTTLIATASDVWIGRVTRAMGPGLVLGGLVTHREGRDYGNSVGGVDAFLRPLRPVEIRFQLLGSSTRYPEAIATDHGQREGTFRGLGAHVEARYATRNWSGQARFERIGASFRADLGFLPRVDTRRIESSVTRRLWGEGVPWLTRIDASLGQWDVRTADGRFKEGGVWSQLAFNGPWQTRVSGNPFWLRERFAGVDFRRAGLNLTIEASPTADLSLGVLARRASIVDYARVRPAQLRMLGATGRYRLGRRVSLEGAIERQVIRHDGLLVNEEIVARMGALIGFSSRAFVSVSGQWRGIRRDGAAHPLGIELREGVVSLQSVFTYRLDGQTALIAGLSEGRDDARPTEGPLDLRRRSRTYFAKVSYAWRP